jgi:hypothetical protein
MMRIIVFLACTVVLLTSCATTSIAPYGKDSYIVSVEDMWGAQSSGKLQVKAAKEASEYCAKQGKVMRVRNTRGEGIQLWTGTSSNLIFSCIDENDPENTRPTLRKEADIIIEDRRR